MTKRHKAEPHDAEHETPAPRWTNEELKANAHLGPGVLGAEMFAAVQAYMASSAGGILGPATRGD